MIKLDLRIQFAASADAVRTAVVEKALEGQLAVQALLHDIAEAYCTDADVAAGRWYCEALAELKRQCGTGAFEEVLGSRTTLSVAGRCVSRPSSWFHLRTLSELLALGVSPNARVPDQEETLLHRAASQSTVAVATLLIERGADIEATAQAGATPLIEAASGNDVGMIKLLLKHGADVHHRCGSGVDALLVAISGNRGSEILSAIIEAGADIHAVRKNGQNPLMAAATNDNAEAIRILVQSGADVRSGVATQSTSLLKAAADYWCGEAVIALLECGADANELKNADLDHYPDDQTQRIRSAIAQNVIFLSATVPSGEESVHNDHTEGSESRRSLASFSPL